MTVAILDPPGAGLERKADVRIFLSCDDSGWTLTGLGNPARQFPSFEEALEGARHDRDSKIATIEIWQGSQYICCLPPTRTGREGRAMPAVLSVEEVTLSAKRWKALTRHIWSTQTSLGFRSVFDEKESGGRGTD